MKLGSSSRVRFVALTGLTCIAVLLGGGGVGAAVPNLFVQIAALACLGTVPNAISKLGMPQHRLLMSLVLASILLVLCQLVPLPHAIWTFLPGREVAQSAFGLIGEPDRTMPLTLDRNRTFIAFLALLPPTVLLGMVLNSTSRQLDNLKLTVVGLGLLNFAIGGVQLVTAQTLLSFYPGAVPNHLYGTFANHNTAGIFFVVCICVCLALPRHAGSGMMAGLTSLVFVCATILTQSRSATILLLLPGSLVLFRLIQRKNLWCYSQPGRRWLVAFIGVGMLTVGIAVSAFHNGKIEQTIDRFQIRDDIRPQVWSDTLYSIARFWPMGSGIGTFDDVFQLDESLEHVRPKTAGRAHNDYLEIALEAGAPGLFIVLGWGIFCWHCVRRALKCDGLMGVTAMSGICCIALQSVVDYPLRSQAMLCLYAILLGMLVRATEPAKTRATRAHKRGSVDFSERVRDPSNTNVASASSSRF